MVFNPTDHEAVRAAVDALMTSVNTTLVDYTDDAVDLAPIHKVYDGSQWPIRPDTSGTNRPVYWWGPSSAALANSGTSSGGTRAAAPGDCKFLS